MKNRCSNLFYIAIFVLYSPNAFSAYPDATEENPCRIEIERAYDDIRAEEARSGQAYDRRQREQKKQNNNGSGGGAPNLGQQLAQYEQQEAQLEAQTIDKLGQIDDKIHEETIKHKREMNDLNNTVFERKVEKDKITSETKSKLSDIEQSCLIKADKDWLEHHTKVNAENLSSKRNCEKMNCAMGDRKHRTGGDNLGGVIPRGSPLWRMYKRDCDFKAYLAKKDVQNKKEHAEYALIVAAEEVEAKREQLQQELPMIFDHYDAQKDRTIASTEIQMAALQSAKQHAMMDAFMQTAFGSMGQQEEEQEITQYNDARSILSDFEAIRIRCDRTNPNHSGAPTPFAVPYDYVRYFDHVERACNIDCIRSSGQRSLTPSDGIGRGQ